MADSTLQTLGRYTIHAELGRGGFATVYRATDTILERDVALKILKPGWTDDAKAVERFMREAKQASRLKHANIVTIFDVGQAEGRLFIAMELVRGRSLQQIITEDEPMAWSRVLTVLEQSATALDYAHKQGLIHRDIKPANIILDESEPGTAIHAILTDFGLVRGAEQASLSMGSTGGLLGTPEYIAPEIWDGEPATKATDIYALGCVAFYLLTGKVLFSATTPMAVLKRHAEGPIFPQQWPSGVPATVEAVLRRALAHEPGQRPASAADFVAELRACEGQAIREQEAREQEARAARQKQEEAAIAAQVALAAETARRAEEERARQEAERKAKEEADRTSREEQERQRQAELVAQAAAKKAKQEDAERERQKLAAEVAVVTAGTVSAPKEGVRASTSIKSPPATLPRSKTWVYAVSAVVVIAIIAVLALSSGNRPAPASAPVMPAQAPAQPAIAPAAAPYTCTDSIGCVDIKPGDPLRIAWAMVVSGSDSTLGIDSRRGVEIAIDDKAGKLLDHSIELVGEDTGCSAEGGQAAAQKLAADKQIIGIVGTSCSSEARVAAPILTDAGLTLISASNTAPDLTDPAKHVAGYLRTAHNDKVQGAVAAEFAYNKLGVKTAATIHDGSLYADQLQQVFAARFKELGGTITSQEAIAPTDTDMGPVLTKVAAAKPEFIYYPVFVAAGGFLTDQARKTPGLEQTPLMGADGMFSPDFLKAAGAAAKGMYHSSPDFSAFGSGYQDFLAKHQAKFGENPLSAFHAHAYDGANIIFAAIEKVAVKDADGTLHIPRKALRDAMFATKDFKGLTGNLTCTATGDCSDPKIAVYQVQNADPATWNPGAAADSNPKKIYP